MMRLVTASATGLRTERRISHVFIMDVPTHPKHCSSLMLRSISFPTSTPSAILFNAIDLFTQIGLGKPRVAILAVETVTTKIPSTIDAAALCKMADRGQITGAILDGPLAFDNAIDPEAARIKGITPQLPAGRRSWSCRISRPATCWQKISSICQKRTWPGWYSVRASLLCLHRVPTPFVAAWRRVPPCFMPRRVANPQASQPREPHGTAILVVDVAPRVSNFKIFELRHGDDLRRQVKGQIDGIGVRPRLCAEAFDGSPRS